VTVSDPAKACTARPIRLLSGNIAAAPTHRSMLAPHPKENQGAIIRPGSVKLAARVTQL
jgi:hypothetical protein